MIPITASFLKILSEDSSLDDLQNVLSSNKILLVGPFDLCSQVSTRLKAFKDKDKSDFGKAALLVVHTESLTLTTSGGNSSEDSGVGDQDSPRKPTEFIPYIVIVTDEGSRAMKNALDNLSLMDVEYLKCPSVDVINWRSNLANESRDRTPLDDLVALSFRFKLVVHTIYGDHRESIDKTVFTLYNRMKAVVRYPHTHLRK